MSNNEKCRVAMKALLSGDPKSRSYKADHVSVVLLVPDEQFEPALVYAQACGFKTLTAYLLWEVKRASDKTLRKAKVK